MAPFFSLTLPLFLFLSPFFLWDGPFFTSYEYCIKLATRLLVLRGLPQTQAGRPRPTQRALLPLFSCKAFTDSLQTAQNRNLQSWVHYIQWRSGQVWPILCRVVLRTHIHIYAPTLHMNENGLIFIEATKLLILSKAQLETVEIFCMKTLHVVNRNPQKKKVQSCHWCCILRYKS